MLIVKGIRWRETRISDAVFFSIRKGFGNEPVETEFYCSLEDWKFLRKVEMQEVKR
jgi:hypothetical protein